MEVTVHPLEDKCEALAEIPETVEEFVETAVSLGIDWDIDDVVTVEEYNSALW